MQSICAGLIDAHNIAVEEGSEGPYEDGEVLAVYRHEDSEFMAGTVADMWQKANPGVVRDLWVPDLPNVLDLEL